MVNLNVIDERLAKIKEEAARLEKARSLLADPQMETLLRELISTPTENPEPNSSVETLEPMPPRTRRPHGELKRKILEVLPDEGATEPISTKEIVKQLLDGGYVFQAKDPEMAVNAALIGLELDNLAMNEGTAARRGKAKLWKRKNPPQHFKAEPSASEDDSYKW